MQLSGRWAIARALFACAAMAAALPADAQDAVSDTDRITQMRDRAAVDSEKQAPVAADSGVAADSTSEQGQAVDAADAKESEKPLPPNESLPLGSSGGGMLDGNPLAGGKSGGVGDGWLLSTLAALGVVLALVFGLRWLLRRGGVVSNSAPRGSVVEVLSRTTIAPRSHVVLMRVGPRILIVNDSTHGMRTLGMVEDPEEVAELLGAIEADRPTSMSKSFSGVMSKLSGGWSDAEIESDQADSADALEDGVAFDQTRGAVSSVRGRLAALAGGGIKA